MPYRLLASTTWFASALLLTMLLPHVGTAFQKQERVVKQDVTADEPVNISRVRTKGGEFLRGKKVIGDESWFEGLTLTVTNTSGKSVTYVSVAIWFQRPQDDDTAHEPPFVHSLSYGRSPAASGAAGHLSPAPVPPGEVIELILSDEMFNNIRTVLKKIKYSGVKSIKLRLEEVFFEDGTRWSGQMFRPDPNNPDKWIPLQQSQSNMLKNTPRFSTFDSLVRFSFPASFRRKDNPSFIKADGAILCH